MPTTDNRPRARPCMATKGAGEIASAQVALAVLCLATNNVASGPTWANAAASDTPWVPTSAKTTSDGFSKRGVSASKTSAANKRIGAPKLAANWIIAGSSALSVIVFTEWIAAGVMFAATRTSWTRAANSAGSQSRAQPTPKVRRCGANCKCASPRSGIQSIVAEICNVSPTGKLASQGASPTTLAPPPDSSAAIAPFASSRLTNAQPAGGSSKATPKATSPAVVTAATAPNASAICAASLFAPRCPPNKGTTTAPSSDTDNTGGSASLSINNGPTARIKMPLAQTPITGTPAANKSRV